jgi:hypothetical protein
MALEDRLLAITQVALGGEFASFSELAQRVHEESPPEFSYNRLEQAHVMQATSIVPYVSLLNLLGILKTRDEDNAIVCMFDDPPNKEGFVTVIDRKAIEVLTGSSFTRDAYVRVVRRMLRQANIVLPTLREVYQGLSLKLSEAQFLQLCSLGGVRAYCGFTVVTRRVMLPSEAQS